jgi:hypothetical protein
MAKEAIKIALATISKKMAILTLPAFKTRGAGRLIPMEVLTDVNIFQFFTPLFSCPLENPDHQFWAVRFARGRCCGDRLF